MIGTVAICAATVSANGSANSRGPGSRAAIGVGKHENSGRPEERELKARILDKRRGDSEHQRRHEREHRHRIGAPTAGRGEHRGPRHQGAADCGGSGATHQDVGGDNRHATRSVRRRDHSSTRASALNSPMMSTTFKPDTTTI